MSAIKDFPYLVAQDWASAVREATSRFVEARSEIVKSLSAHDPNVRAAAIAVFIEANDETVHDQIAALVHDPSKLVQEEALEYLGEFPVSADASVLLRIMKTGEHYFLSSFALNKLHGYGPIINDDDGSSSVSMAIAQWEAIVG
ncbi:HEAT repeat domain-containing protein [Zoogloeaceae bacterium G21618-S1]|nr:HEAT repeat domain-containing protein [Zoogloeaceae bacterium G21618-S1]